MFRLIMVGTFGRVRVWVRVIRGPFERVPLRDDGGWNPSGSLLDPMDDHGHLATLLENCEPPPVVEVGKFGLAPSFSS